MPFKEDAKLLFEAAKIAARAQALRGPRRLQGLVVAGIVPAIDLAFESGPLSLLSMCFNEFCNFCLIEGLAAAAPGLAAAAPGLAAASQAKAAAPRAKAAAPRATAAETAISTKAAAPPSTDPSGSLVTLDWHGGTQFLLCVAAPPEAALLLCRAFAERRSEFARVHRWPGRLVLGVTAGELVFASGGPDGQRALRAFGDPTARACKLAHHGERLAAGDPGIADFVVCGPELEELLMGDLAADEDARVRVTCATA